MHSTAAIGRVLNPFSSVPTLKGDDAFKSLNMIQKGPYFLGLDLNIDSASRTVTAVPAAESIDASRPARFFAVDAPSSADDVPPVRGALCRRAQGQKLLVSGSVPVHGLPLCANVTWNNCLRQFNV
jgi:hypothetical protein